MTSWTECSRSGSWLRRSMEQPTSPSIRLLADELGIARRDLQIVAGATSRQKLVVVDGVDADEIVARWPGLRV